MRLWAVVVALVACGGCNGAVRVPRDAVDVAPPDFIVGTALNWQEGDPAVAAKRRGYEVFLRSARAAAPHAYVLLIADDGNWGALPADLRDDAHVVRATPAELIALLPRGGVHAAWRRTRIQYGRYALYPPALEFLRRRFALDVAPAGPWARAAAPSASCHRHLRDPFVLFTDTRDVLLQTDVFEAARRVAAAALAASPPPRGGNVTAAAGAEAHNVRVTPALLAQHEASTPALPRRVGGAAALPDWRGGAADACAPDPSASPSAGAFARTLPPLLVVEEPDEFPVADDDINIGWLRSCFREADLARVLGGSRPILCSGTTAGSWAAAAAYADAMVGLLPYCMAAQKRANGIDQSVHLMAVYAAVDATPTAPAGTAAAGAAHDAAAAAAAEAAEPAFAAFVTESAALLRDRVALLRVSHDVGWVCTLGLVVMARRSPVIVAVAAAGNATASDGRGGAADPATLMLAPAVGHAPCALVHQYDRSALPIMVADALTRRAAAAAAGAAGRGSAVEEFCQEEDGEATKLCWTAASVRAGLPPREVAVAAAPAARSLRP